HRSHHAAINERHTAHRHSWFGCACCPPNVARLLASLGSYIYAESDDEAVVHLYIGGSGELQVAGQTVRLHQQADYPWDGAVTIRVEPEQTAEFTVVLRIPGW